jgi:hypothetical protein
MKYINVTIWGYPLYSDTFSYVWQGFAKAFKAHKLVARVIWLEDTPENCLKFMNTWDRTKTNIVLCEGHQAKFLPIATDATYFVHCPKKEDIERYQKAKKFIDLRYHCDYQDHPVNYNYVLDTWKCQSLGPLAHYENNSEYDRLYLAWATDLLPEEFDYQFGHLLFQLSDQFVLYQQPEHDNDHFTVEKSYDITSWEEIGQVIGTGNSEMTSDYTLVDRFPRPGLNYYRLSQTDIDGTTVELKTIVVIFGNANTRTRVMDVSGRIIDDWNTQHIFGSGLYLVEDEYGNVRKLYIPP